MYDFKSLSSFDFELLVRDLLQKHFNTFLESFKPGPDKGIDLRHAAATDGSLIIQCKHYAETGWAGLLRTLKKEVPKVKRLAPARYCVATSVALSPANKAEINSLFTPYCKGPQDIFGLAELNNLLGQFADIERQHFKLWLTSTVLLERILHSGLYSQTSVFVDILQNKVRRYVQSESFFDAQEILKQYNHCIISGIPGIGKTFLAEILLLQHITNGYQPFVVRSHIREAFELLDASRKQVFYYDDFLGQTGWEGRLEKNEEQSILDFLAYVKAHNQTKFILTTREYILQQARSVYEKLRTPEFNLAKCIVQLESYTRRNRAHILFNHVYFSSLPAAHKKALVQKKTLLSIVDHKNYSPRIIEWMSDYQNIRDCAPSDYSKYFLDTLANPSELWRHAFRNHLSPVSRSLLIVLTTFPLSVELSDLKEALDAFRVHEGKLFGGSLRPYEIRAALEELEGSFIRCERDHHNVVITYHNPSVRDFLEMYLAENAEYVHILCSSLVFYDQFLTLFGIRAGKPEHEQIVAALRKHPKVLVEAIIRTVERSAKQIRLLKKLDGTFMLASQFKATTEKHVAHALSVAKQLPYEQKTFLVRHLLDLETSRLSSETADLGDLSKTIQESLDFEDVDINRTALIKAASLSLEDAKKEYEELDEVIVFHQFMKLVPNAVSEDLVERVKEKLLKEADSIFDWDISNATDEHEIYNLRKIARELEQAFVIDLSSVHDSLDELEEDIRSRIEEVDDDWFERGEREMVDASDSDIVAMFNGLEE